MSRIKELWGLWRFRRKYGRKICRNCVYRLDGCCTLRTSKHALHMMGDEDSCDKIFTLYDAARQRLEWDRLADKER